MQIKEYFTTNWEFIFIVILVIVFTVSTIAACIEDNQAKEKYGEIKYEIVIKDKYDYLGSNFHLIGGRATEQEYYVEYNYRLTNRPGREDNMKWYRREEDVSASEYRKIKVGKTYFNDYPRLLGINF